jgi:hypothetical protein
MGVDETVPCDELAAHRVLEADGQRWRDQLAHAPKGVLSRDVDSSTSRGPRLWLALAAALLMAVTAVIAWAISGSRSDSMEASIVGPRHRVVPTGQLGPPLTTTRSPLSSTAAQSTSTSAITGESASAPPSPQSSSPSGVLCTNEQMKGVLSATSTVSGSRRLTFTVTNTSGSECLVSKYAPTTALDSSDSRLLTFYDATEEMFTEPFASVAPHATASITVLWLPRCRPQADSAVRIAFSFDHDVALTESTAVRINFQPVRPVPCDPQHPSGLNFVGWVALPGD